MGVERLFHETAQGWEPVTRADLGLLRAVGIRAGPFFKFTTGGHSAAVFAYREGKDAFVVRFKREDDPRWDVGVAGLLKDRRIPVAEFLGNFDVSKKGLRYEKEGKLVGISYYDKARWVGYDFNIQGSAAVSLLEKCGYRTDRGQGGTAMEIIRRIGRASGRAFGKLYVGGLLYRDFTPYNLAGDEEAFFFDIQKGSFLRTGNVETCLKVWYAFFEYADWYPEGKEIRTVKAFLKAGFVDGLNQSGASQSLVRKVAEKKVGGL